MLITSSQGHYAVKQVNLAVHLLEGKVYRLTLSWRTITEATSYHLAIYSDRNIDSQHLLVEKRGVIGNHQNTADRLRSTVSIDSGANSLSVRIQTILPGDETSFIIIDDVIKFY
ncbi:MAG: hypothetical protein SFV52_09865 [Saprospiraceae bacterium]|nr:hypothetical protein [Saprospiraceae bacterium]